jgi:hypothetical protein
MKGEGRGGMLNNDVEADGHKQIHVADSNSDQSIKNHVLVTALRSLTAVTF